jgi:hypothetical protein
VGCLQILVQDDAEHVVEGVVMRLHPGADVTAGVDPPSVDVRFVTERLLLLGDPEHPIAIALRIADEDLGHGEMIGSGEGGFKPRIGRGGLSSRRLGAEVTSPS